MNAKLISLLFSATACLAVSTDIDQNNRLNPDHAPTPFSAEEIRDASPSGHYSIFLVQQSGAEPFRLVSEFTRVDGETAAFIGWREDLDGAVIGDIMTASATWSELQAHASFPQEQTKITEKVIAVPAGKWTCWIYSIDRSDGTIMEMAFAKGLPGPPVRMHVIDGEDVVYSMELVETGMRKEE